MAISKFDFAIREDAFLKFTLIRKTILISLNQYLNLPQHIVHAENC